MVYQGEVKFSTRGHGHLQDISQEVQKIVSQSEIDAGIVTIFNVGSTAAITTIEFEPGLEADLPNVMDKLIAPSPDYGHEGTWHDGNAHSHLQASILGASMQIPVRDGQLVIGTWQQICHLECDIKPRKRIVIVTVIGDE
jgi:secondary thiamine-phosphate synthase enzyme